MERWMRLMGRQLQVETWRRGCCDRSENGNERQRRYQGVIVNLCSHASPRRSEHLPHVFKYHTLREPGVQCMRTRRTYDVVPIRWNVDCEAMKNEAASLWSAFRTLMSQSGMETIPWRYDAETHAK
jgi:hypothetical protein